MLKQEYSCWQEPAFVHRILSCSLAQYPSSLSRLYSWRSHTGFSKKEDFELTIPGSHTDENACIDVTNRLHRLGLSG